MSYVLGSALMILCFIAGLYLPVLYGVVTETQVMRPSDVKRTLATVWEYYYRLEADPQAELQKMKLIMAFMILPTIWFYLAVIYWTFDKMGTTIVWATKLIFSGILAFGSLLVSGYEELSWRVRFRRNVSNPTVNDPYNTLECMRDGSPLIKKEPPSFQMVVWHPEGTISGGAIRMDDYLVTPAHVLPNMSNILVSKTVSSTCHMVKPEKVYTLTTDLVAVKLSETAWARLAISKAKARPIESAVLVSIVGPLSDKNATTGTLKEIDVLGMTGYYGSTVPGFSGCAYTCNNMFLGIHRAGGKSGRVNTGFAAMYVRALLDFAVTEEVEESSDYLASLVRAEEEPTMNQIHTGDYMVKSKGKYYVLSEAETEELRGKRARTLAFDDTLSVRASKSAKEVEKFIADKRARNELVWADLSDEEESMPVKDDKSHFLVSGRPVEKPGPSRGTQTPQPETPSSSGTSQSSLSSKKQLIPTNIQETAQEQIRKKNKKVFFYNQSEGPNSTKEVNSSQPSKKNNTS